MESPLFRCVALCAEFPNDNPSLYREAPWEALDGEPAGEPVVEAEGVAEVQAATAEVEPVVDGEMGTDPTPPVLEADDESDDIEIVEDLVIDDAVEEAPSIPPPAPSAPPPAADDPFDALVAVVEDVARGAGASDAAMRTLGMLIGRERIAADAPAEHSTLRTAAAAWRAILRGESEDFSACGASTLDEWSSMLVAAALGEPARADSLRRELRRRGVAAFGLVVEAA